MKQFINRKCFPLIILLLIIGLILVVGFLLGFRITYAPELENSWNAISSVATWAGVIVSVASAVASFMAVLYAVRVADYQNRIALFEKRYELYEIVFNFCTFSDSLKNATNALDIRMMFLTSFCYSVIDNEKIKDSSFISAKYVATIQNLKQLPFLFGNFDCLDCLPELINALSNVVLMGLNQKEEPDFIERIKKFTDYVDSEEYKKLLDTLQNQLLLK